MEPPEVAKKSARALKANFQVGRRLHRQWKINWVLPKLPGRKPLQLRVKFNPAIPGTKSASGTFTCSGRWQS